jgi:DinB superfamily
VHSECSRIADQLRRELVGEPWHGTPLRDLLAGVTAEQALARPLPNAHNIWELLLHMDVWASAASDAARGAPMAKIYQTEKDWPVPDARSAMAWQPAIGHFFMVGERLAEAISDFPDSRLQDIVPGRKYDFYFLFHGIVQHNLYHGGQIALLKKAVNGG